MDCNTGKTVWFEKNDIDRVVHFAAESHVDRSIRNPEVFVQTNVLGTAVMLNCAKAAWELEDGIFKEGKKFLHVSTDEVFGSLGDEGYFSETSPIKPNSPYSASKASSDFIVKAFHDTFEMNTIISHCSNNYGTHQYPEKLIPVVINKLMQRQNIPVYGNGKKLSLEDGNVSALLHLDMEHLGTVDIHVEMSPDKQVKTNFYFEDEAMLDFVYENIDMLNERLEKRGYGPITNVQMKDDTTKTPVSEILEKNNDTPILLKTQAFDARI